MSPDAYAPGEPGSTGFDVAFDGARWVLSGAVTFANAGAVLEAARRLPLPTSGVIDCAALHPIDSTGVAVLLAIKRRALSEGQSLTFANVTASLHTLADLYGVEDLLAA